MVWASRSKARPTAAAVHPCASSQIACHRSRSRGVGARYIRRRTPASSMRHLSSKAPSSGIPNYPLKSADHCPGISSFLVWSALGVSGAKQSAVGPLNFYLTSLELPRRLYHSLFCSSPFCSRLIFCVSSRSNLQINLLFSLARRTPRGSGFPQLCGAFLHCRVSARGGGDGEPHRRHPD